MSLQKMYFKSMALVLPAIAAKQVYRVMSNPRIKKLREFDEEVLAKAKKETVRVQKLRYSDLRMGRTKR